MADENPTPPVVSFDEKTVDALKVSIDSLENEKAALAAELQDVRNQLTLKSGQLTVLAQEVEGHKTELREAENLLEGQKGKIDELTASLEKLQASPSTVPTFILNKKTYEVHATTFKFRTGSSRIPTEYTVEELLKDKTLQAELVKKGAGFITEKA